MRYIAAHFYIFSGSAKIGLCEVINPYLSSLGVEVRKRIHVNVRVADKIWTRDPSTVTVLRIERKKDIFGMMWPNICIMAWW